MKFSIADIESTLRSGKDSSWEFKQVDFACDVPKSPTRHDWANTIAAIANTEGGVLLFRVRDDGTVIGMSFEQIKSLSKLLVEVCSDAIKPPVRIRTFHRELSGGELILIVEVPQSESVHSSPDGFFVRVGASERMIREDERLRLAQKRSQARYVRFDEQLIPETGFGTLYPDLWKPLLSTEGQSEPAVGLEKLALVHDEGNGVNRATVAGVLFCTPNPENWLPNACIMATHYRGTDRSAGQIDAAEITGPLFQQIANAVGFAVKNMKVAARKDPARTNLPQYSAKAIFEAVVNAVVHRDYSFSRSRIRLSMFTDRMEIQSPGALPNNLTVESMASRQAVRNEALASIISRMRVGEIPGSEDKLYIMERRGDGVPVIRRETWELSGKHPVYEVIDGSEVLLTIPAALQEPSPASPTIAVQSESQPLQDVEVLLLYPNKTSVRTTTNQEGETTFELHTTHLPMMVFVAAPGYSAHLERNWIPSDRALVVNLKPLPKGGSIIFLEGSGCISRLNGQINPVRDPYDRTCLYARRIAINGGRPQPVYFVPGEQISLTDSAGINLQIRVIEIFGRSALVEYSSA